MNLFRCRILLGFLIGSIALAAEEKAPQPADPIRLLFSGSDDILAPWGKLSFGATSLQMVANTDLPGMAVYCDPLPDGVWEVFAAQYTLGPDKGKIPDRSNSWKLVRVKTRDGKHYDRAETVLESPVGPWMDNFAMAYNPEAREFFFLTLKADRGGFQYTAFFSADGRQWNPGETNPLFHDGDAMGVFWSPALHRLVCTSKSLQPYRKHIIDHGGPSVLLHDDALRDRRVLMIRSSSDGRHWEPDVSMADIWDREGRKAAVPDRFLIQPDSEDPPDLEFYSGSGFWYHDRSYLMMLNYAASPLLPRQHGPHLDTEWWVSRNGLQWDRPWRNTPAMGDTFPENLRLNCNPLLIGGMILFPIEHDLLGLKQDRLSCVSARANGEFSTRPFVMPEAGLRLNAACPAPDRAFAFDQAYVMVAICDQDGAVIPGYEAEKCVIQNADAIDLPLQWAGDSAHRLAGKKISLRIHLRSANLYAVTSQ